VLIKNRTKPRKSGLIFLPFSSVLSLKVGQIKKVINICPKPPETLALPTVHHFFALFFPRPNPCRFQPVLREFFGLFSLVFFWLVFRF